MRPTSDVITRRVGRKVRRIRQEEQVSQEELGRRICLTKYQVSRMERGLRRITVDELVQIAVALDRISMDFFVEVFEGF